MSAQPRPDPEDASTSPAPAPTEQPLVDRPEVDPTPATPGSAERDARHRRRLSTRIPLGAAIGAAAGAAFGGILGAIAFASTAGILGSALTGALALGTLGGFWGGMASLETTDVGAEPSGEGEPLGTDGVATERERTPRH